MGFGKMFVKLSFYLMVYPSTRSYVIIQFCVCFCPSDCLPVRVLSVYVSVRPCVLSSACMHIFVILFVILSVCMFSFRSFFSPIVFHQYDCMPVRLLSAYMYVTYLISNFLFLTSNF